jgi:hypothetical protein
MKAKTLPGQLPSVASPVAETPAASNAITQGTM